jgi:hypothetical protein
MNVRDLIEQLQQQDPDATVIVIDEDTGSFEHLDRVMPSEDPPDDGSAEVWIIKAERA